MRGSSFATNLVRGLLAPFEGTLIRDSKGNILSTVKKQMQPRSSQIFSSANGTGVVS
jgi:hypothetical protein